MDKRVNVPWGNTPSLVPSNHVFHQMKKPWYLYLVRCRKGALYTGITNNLNKRIQKHNNGTGSRAVKALGLPVVLVYSKLVGEYRAALRLEAQIKKLPKESKEKLVTAE